MVKSVRNRKNILYCFRHETQMGWLIDPDEQILLVYRPQQEPLVLDQPDDAIPVPSFAKELHLTINTLFAWLW